ncbi:hypothetical protein P7D81_03265 [Enterococcus avium]|uniref:hypothetical protein n=1 Tax=Enterococcus avium TaxID=33945 RepID=UPI0012AC2B85|nr:hypothetical protein [Enterococcus avium]MDT2408259.1 hypothetical protein [Enterococcus avium]MDT2412753.1 hypothetical protein [Enterococcus avium]MDT2443134.1 hypothetical protein [Enterococcus avium]MDT2473394.1 hypothetical protein [Enterococcus avium]MDT2487304.1 hypothetical protein [Enterococcus avium]
MTIGSTTSNSMLQIGVVTLKYLEIIGLTIVVVALGLWVLYYTRWFAFRRENRKQEQKQVKDHYQTAEAASGIKKHK